jgi:hypothetical protein
MIPPFVLALLISIAGYYALLHISLAVMGLQASDYVNALVGWGHGTPITVLLRNIINPAYTLFLAPGAIGAVGVRLTIIALILTSVLGIVCYKGWKRFLIPVMCVLLGLSPFALALALMGFMPLRSMQALPLMMGIAWCFMFMVIGQSTAKRTAVVIPYIIAIALIFGQIQTLNRMYYGDRARYEMDRQLAAMIIHDVKREFGSIPDAPFMFLGAYQHPLNSAVVIRSEALGGSFWSWDDGNNDRMIAFLRMEGYDIERVMYNVSYMEAIYREQMPIWPRDGSIIETEHGIMIRLS